RRLVLLRLVIVVAVLKVCPSGPPVASVLLADGDGDVAPVLERDPAADIVGGPLPHGPRHTTALPRPRLVMPDEVARRCHLAIYLPSVRLPPIRQRSHADQ